MAGIGSEKLESALVKELDADGRADFFIVLAEQADLSGAADLPTKEAKGQYVFDTLRTTADRTQAALRAELDAQGVTYQPFYISNKILVRGGTTALTNALAVRPDVAALVANHSVQLPEPYRGDKSPLTPAVIEPNLTFINADDVWAGGIDGEGVVVAGNDTGIQWNHPALINQYRGWDGVTADHNYSWWDATGTYPSVPGDGNGHGTHTTGTMVGDDGGDNQIGVAPGAGTIHCKNLDDGGSGWDVDIIECFQWDLAPWDLSGANPRPDLAPDVINNSWGGWGGNPVFETEIENLQAAGILVEFSAGNSGPGCFSLGSPGDFPQVLTTGSVDHSGGTLPGTLTWFSSRGPSPFSEIPIPDIMAPGENIRSSVPGNGYAAFSGTSMSGPHVVGLVALMYSANPALRGFIPETQELIMQTAVPLTGQSGSNCGGDYDEGPNNDWGHGTVDAYAAVEAAQQFGAPGTLAGLVSDAGSGNPIAGATVRATLSPELSWKRLTNEQGLYSLRVFSGTYTVEASKYGFFPQSFADVAVVSDQTTTRDFTLTPAPFYTVSGVVRDATTGWPLYAAIAIDGYPGGRVWTDPATGAYTIDLAAGVAYAFRVTAWSEGYNTAVTPVGPLSGAQSFDFALVADPVQCVAPGYVPQFTYLEDFESDDGAFTAEGDLTSWQWGPPTSGPGRAHSGDNVWATNLAGSYFTNENGYTVSPVYDMSAFAGQTIIVAWWQWLQVEDFFDNAGVEASADGGATWTPIYGPVTGDVSLSWQKQTIFLDPSYATAGLRLRFWLGADFSIEFPGFYIDDIGVGVAAAPPALYATDFEANDGGYAAAGANSSWAWGVPTRGPGSAHTGVNAWATNLDGNYNDNEDSTLTSPVIDLSGAAGQPLTLSWWQWLQTEALYDTARVEASADGGATWQVMTEASGPVNTEWTRQTLFLDSSYAVADFRLRLGLVSDGSVTYPGFYVDDINVTLYSEAPPSVACSAQAGSLVVGHVRDANTTLPLNGARVETDGRSTASRPTPDDPAVDDGFYTLFANAGSQTLTASRARYSSVSHTLTVPDGATLMQTFLLEAALLTAQPASVSATLNMGETATRSFDLRNDGGLSTAFQLRERNIGFTPLTADGRPRGEGRWLQAPGEAIALRANSAGGELAPAYPSAYTWQPLGPAGDPTILVYADDFVHTAPNTFPDQALQWRGLPYTAYYDGNFTGFQAALSGGDWEIVIYAGDNYFPPDNLLDDLNTYVQNGGKLIYHSWTMGFLAGHPLFATLGGAWSGDDFDPPDPVYWWDPSHPVFTVPQEVPEFTALNRGIYGIYGQQLAVLDGFTALAGYTTPGPDIGQAALILGNDGRTLFRGFLDGQNDANLDGDAFQDGLELWINQIDGIRTEFNYDVAWFSTDIVSGTLPANSQQNVVVTFDASVAEINQPGTYAGSLRVINDAPYGFVTVPVNLTVNAPSDWGKVAGVLSGLARCDVAPGAPLNRATVAIAGVADILTAADGSYGYWLPAGVYDVTFSQPGYVPETRQLSVLAGGITHSDEALRPDVPCAQVDPTAVTVIVEPGETATLDITLSNSGAAGLNFVVLESDFDFGLEAPLRSVAQGRRLFDTTPVDGPTSLRGGAPRGTPIAAGPLSGWFGGVDNPGGAVRQGAAQCQETPESFYIVAGVDRFFGITDALWRYDATDNNWVALPAIPDGQEAPAAVCYQGRIYVLGGGGSNQFYIYDILSAQWWAGAPLPRGVEGAAVGAWNGRLYLIGGDDDFFPGSGVSDQVDIYDIAADMWVGNGAPMPVAVGNAGFVQTGPYVTIVGGWGVEAPERNVDATQRYDMRTDSWELGPTFASARADFALAATASALYALGGDADGGFFFDPTLQTERLGVAAWPDGEWLDMGDPLPIPLTANNAGFCTSALFNERAEVWTVGGFDGNNFAITGRTLFNERAGENCYSLYSNVPWLEATPAAGLIGPGGERTLRLTIGDAALTVGAYRATLVVVSDDPGAAQIRIPIVLYVGAPFQLHLPAFFRP